MAVLRIPAHYMRGGTSKGVFFVADDLPADPQLRDRLLLRVVGSPDRYHKQIDGMGAATSSTSKVVIVWRSNRPDTDVEYLFGQVAIDRPLIDWSGNCGNLTTAVGPFAIARGLVQAPRSGTAIIRMWQATLEQSIIARVPVEGGEPCEDGAFELDGVSLPAAEIGLEFLEPGDRRGADRAPPPGVEALETSGAPLEMFPTGRAIDRIEVPGLGPIEATLITAGNPTVFVEAAAFGLSGIELQSDLTSGNPVLEHLEATRARASVAMGLAPDIDSASRLRPATPKIAFISPPRTYTASDGRKVEGTELHLCARILSMGAVAIAVAAAVPGTLVHRILQDHHDPVRTVFGHPSGRLTVGAQVSFERGRWSLVRALMSRSARTLMEGRVVIPARTLEAPGLQG
jgi:probable AcnD-accessory protein PrpF